MEEVKEALENAWCFRQHNVLEVVTDGESNVGDHRDA